MIKKYTIVRHLIQRNNAQPSDPQIKLPFVTIGRGDAISGNIKAANSIDGKKIYLRSEINFKMHGDLQS